MKVRDVAGLAIAAVISCVACLPLCSGAQDDPDAQKAESFIESVAKTIYNFAWPTATFQSVRFAGFARDGNNLIVQATFSGTGALGDTASVKLGLVVNKDGILPIPRPDRSPSRLTNPPSDFPTNPALLKGFLKMNELLNRLE